MIVMFLRRTAGVLLCWLTAVALSGCGSPARSSGRSDRLAVTTSIYPLGYVVGRVGGDRIALSLLTAPGVEPHDLELTPKAVAELAEADLVIYQPGLQPAVDKAVAQNASDAALDVSAASRPIPAGDRSARNGSDPHFWQDPTRMTSVAGAVASRLTELDPAGGQAYARNASALTADLNALDAEFRNGLARCSIRTVVTAHDAFGYLGHRYRLKVAGIAGLEPDTEPSPARIRLLKQIVARERVTTIFTETLVSPKVAETLSRETGAKVAVLDPIEGLATAGSRDDYLSLMRRNLQTLKTANDCR